MQDGPLLSLGLGEAQEGSFGNTDWWVVHRAGEPGRPEGDNARARICHVYWKPVFRYVRRAGHNLEDAEDLTQEFFARLLEKNSLFSADPKKGRFRTFLLTLLKRFLADQWDWEHCQKRGAGMRTVSLDSGDTEFRRRLEPVDELNPETICERNWAQLLLHEAFKQLEKECIANGRAKTFEGLRPLVVCEGQMSYGDTARRLEVTEASVKVTVHRLRQRLRELLRAEIQKSGTPGMSVAEELHDLYVVLSQ